MVNSVNTNFGATIALQSLNRTSRELDIVQKRVSTGYRVSDAKDDGASFAVLQGLRADIKANEAVNERLSVAKGLLSVAQQSLIQVSNGLGDLVKTLVKLGDDALSTEERTQYGTDSYNSVVSLVNLLSKSGFNGKNLLNTNTDMNVISDAGGGTITLSAVDLVSTLTGLGAIAAANGNDIRTNILNPGGVVDDIKKAVNDQLAALGANMRSVENQDNFIHVMRDALGDAVGTIADADLAKDSAKLQALQIRQQLGTQTLSIANQSPSILLSLFR